jgi:hypothetical protein
VAFLSVLYGNGRHAQPSRSNQLIRWMDFPHGFVFEEQNYAFSVLVRQPVFLAGSGVDGHDDEPVDVTDDYRTAPPFKRLTATALFGLESVGLLSVMLVWFVVMVTPFLKIVKKHK